MYRYFLPCQGSLTPLKKRQWLCKSITRDFHILEARNHESIISPHALQLLLPMYALTPCGCVIKSDKTNACS